MFINTHVLVFVIILLQYSVAKNSPESGSNQNLNSQNAVRKSCRFSWEWESLIYGNLCLPAKSSLFPRKKSTSITRHKNRHKNRGHNDKPNSRSSLFYKRKGLAGNVVNGAPIDGELLENTAQYQMDAPKYLSVVSSIYNMSVYLCLCSSYCRELLVYPVHKVLWV